MAFSIEPGIYLPGGTAPASRTSSCAPRPAASALNLTSRELVVALMASTVERLLPSDDARDLLELTREIADAELAPAVAAAEHDGRRSRGRRCERWGSRVCSRCPTTSGYGGGGQPYEVYLQVLEELSYAWLSVGLSVSVHSLACFPLATYGTAQQQEAWLPDMLSGELLGAYCLSEPQSGSDAAALQTRATADGDDYVVTGTKAWITHGGLADFYDLMVRTGG